MKNWIKKWLNNKTIYITTTILSISLCIFTYIYYSDRYTSFIDYNTYQMLERNNWLNDWLVRNNENSEWYEKNKDNLKITYNWIEILWDIFSFEDNKIDESYSNIENYIYNNEMFLKKFWNENNIIASDWWKYINFIPWNNDNKLSFLVLVLWLKTNDRVLSINKSDIFSSCYWNNTGDKLLYISDNEIISDKVEVNKHNCRIRTINNK